MAAGPRVAVVRMLPGLGDLLCAVPALAGLRRTFPSAEVTLVGRRSSSWFLDRFPDLVDDLLGCDWCPGLVESTDDPAALGGVLGSAQARCFDVAIQMHGDGTATNAFTAALGARHWGGLARRPLDHVRTVPAGAREIDRCVEAVRATGADIEPGPMVMAMQPTDSLPAALPTGSFAVVHAGASRPTRRWPASSFAAVSSQLLDHVEHVVLTGGPGEGDVVQAVRAAVAARSEGRLVDLHGRTDIGSLTALLDSARIVVSNDTGVAHLAAAVRAPTVTIFGHPDRSRWEPPGAVCVGGSDGWPCLAEVVAATDALLARSTPC